MNVRTIETGRGEHVEIWDSEKGTVRGVYRGLSVEADTEANFRAKINWLAYHNVGVEV